MSANPAYKVLIVDDNQHNLYTLKTLIEKHLDAQVLEASNGPEAIAITLEQRDIDLIVLDVQMPEMDGFQTASLLKLRKRTRDIPILFLTAAFRSEEFQQRGFAAGAVDYLLKPIDDLLLINKIGTYFRLIAKERELNRTLERMVAERTAELEREKQYSERIITHMGEALLVLNPAGEITFANPAACGMLNYRAEDLIGMPIGDVFEEETDEEAGAFMGIWLEALIRTGALRNIEARFIARDGRRVPILFSRTALLDPDGQISDIICIAKNMTGYARVADASRPDAETATEHLGDPD